MILLTVHKAEVNCYELSTKHATLKIILTAPSYHLWITDNRWAHGFRVWSKLHHDHNFDTNAVMINIHHYGHGW